MRVSGLKTFSLWTVVGALYGLAILGFMSVGIFILAVAIVITVIAVRSLEVWPAILGIALGPAAALVRLGFSNLGCDDTGEAVRKSYKLRATSSSSAAAM